MGKFKQPKFRSTPGLVSSQGIPLRPSVPKERLFIGIPSYNGDLSTQTFQALQSARNSPLVGELMVQCSSALTLNFNKMPSMFRAKRLKDPSFTHFVMIHSDLGTFELNWVEIMMAEMAAKKLTVLSLHSPIKSSEGILSLGFDYSHMPGLPPKHVRRMTTSEASSLPATLVSDADWATILPDWKLPEKPILCMNTGFMMMDFRDERLADFFFTIDNGLWVNGSGQPDAWFEPEDWAMSRWLNARGIRYGSTKLIKLEHIGTKTYDNQTVWGEPLDPGLFTIKTA